MLKDDSHIYMLDFTNKGGLVIPLFVEIEYTDGIKEERRYLAEIWKLNYDQMTKMIITDQEIASVVLDPNYEMTDVDMNNNFFPRRILESRFDLAKERSRASMRRDMMNENREKVKSIEDIKAENKKTADQLKQEADRRFKEWVEKYN